MKIDYLKIENYRQYKGPLYLKFSKDENKNFTIIKGTNGAGKTNFLNAITWCLYEKELHKNTGGAIYNDLLVNEIINGESFEVSVELGMTDSKNRNVTILRKLKFTKNDNKIYKDVFSDSQLSVRIIVNGNDKFLEHPELYIQKNLPEKIEGYFFFDGEKLEDYFDDNSGDNIKEAVFKISQINLFNNLNKHLISLERSINKDFKKLDTDFADFLEIKQKLNDKIRLNKKEIEESSFLLNKTKKDLKIVDEDLRKIDHSDKNLLDEQKQKLNIEIEKLDKREEKLDNDKKNLVIKYFPLILAYKPFKKFVELGSDLEEKGFIPPLYKKKFLETLMENEKCICGNELKLNSESYNKIQKLHELTFGVTDISEEINIELNNLKNEIKRIQRFSTKQKEYNAEIRDIRNQRIEKNEDLENVNFKLSQIDHDEIQRLIKRKNDLDDQKDKYVGKVAYSKNSIDFTSKELLNIEKKEIKVNNDSENALKLKKKLDFCKDAIIASESLKSKLIENIRNKIEKLTNDQFKKLMWKENFTMVKVDEYYNIDLVNKARNLVSPNDISAGERLALALSFVAALNQISGFDLPLIIDTPMGRLDKEIKTNIAKTLPNYVEGKQVVLLVTGEEYTSKFKSDIIECVGKEYEIRVFETDNGTESRIL
ncbi:hypothetical protein SDC9_07708 [bioreactor metagenome]|uniref:Endonuclease GajA/Old nuclease/RecF-like AAA domain-containing protein n=1 Tax=bioreactor metagenome TaxID=1076179 RepID=A0A644T5R0_9ZZZZ|nr:AAA family ATPase [Methanobrevibacter sp.]MEA4956573.1 AAA family ATPase [Methanobrevibacter sp.]